ncbi:DUF5906 domain-containing protein [Streptomyces sp. NRRL S-455]|uniref:DUF5906 domain-containing protein n=1 Tax=Streptomyces sp. NRRL S-455 TaxID=1463908 RepID=UPI0004C10FE8|nr:DUF5906 domain-containing protein [Streptomyces sp. NRRL S-455]
MDLDPNLREMADDLESELAWNPGLGWLYWDGKVWVTQFGADEAADRVNQWREAHGHRRLSDRHVRTILRQLQVVLEIDVQTLDSHPGLLNVQNGVVDLFTGTLHPHDPTLRLTKVAAVDYNPDAQSPAWDQVLASLPSGASSPLGSFVARAVTGEPADSAAVLHGPGSSGKSTFLRPLCDALGSHALYSVNWPLAGDLRGVRFVVAEEIGRINTGKLKLLLTESTIVTRHLHRNPFEFKPSHSLALVTGPHDDRELDEGTRRRLNPIEFEELTDPDPSLRPRLKETEALRAALAWAVGQVVRAH